MRNLINLCRFGVAGWLVLFFPGAAGAADFEVGSIATDNTYGGSYTRVCLQGTFTQTPLIFTVATSSGSDPCAMRIRDVTTTPVAPCTGASFLASCAEPSPEDGPHISIDMHFIAITPGARLLANTDGTTTLVEAGTNDTQTLQHGCPAAAGCGAEGWDNIAFSTTFPNAPAVLAQVQTVANETSIVDPTLNNPPPAIPWLTSAVQNVTTTGFELALERSEADAGAITVDETIGWLAIEQTGGCRSLDLGGGASVQFEAAAIPTQLDGWDDGCNAASEGYDFACTYGGNPLVVGTKRTHNGGDGGWLRRCSLNASTVVFTVDEDQANDGERNHTDEAGSVVAFENDFVCFAATQALIASVRAFHQPAGVEVAWETAAEAETLAFRVERLDEPTGRYVPITAEPVVALLDSPQGGAYRVADPEAPPNARLTYRLVEIEPSGKRRIHGPFAVAVEEASEDGLGDLKLRRTAHRMPRRPQPKAAVSNGLPEKTAVVGAKIAVRQTGLVRVPAADLAAALELPLADTLDLIATRNLALTQRRRNVAWQPSPDGQALELYGVGLASPYTQDNIYRLRVGAGQIMRQVGHGTASTPAPAFFTETLRFENDARPVTLLPLDPTGDTWFWDFVQAGQAGKTFTFELPGVAPPDGWQAELSLDFQGASDDPHELEVRLNGAVVSLPGEVTVDRLQAARVPLSPNASLLLEGPNQLEIQATAGGLVFLDGFDVTYTRRTRAGSDALRHRVEVPGQVAVDGFSGPGIRVFNLRFPHRPQRIVGTSESPDANGGYQVEYAAPRPDTPYLVVGPGGTVSPASVTSDHASDLRDPSSAGQYLVITRHELAAEAENLANLRRADGLSARVVLLEDIYDEWNHGIEDPNAIRSFLAWATSHWVEPPAYVALVGAGTYDYRDLLGAGGNLIPPLLAQSSGSIFATDTPLADFDDDGVADVALGRIPVTTAAELAAYTAKVAAYESSLGDSADRGVVLLADNPDTGGRFPEDTQALADRLNPAIPQEIIDLASQPLADARQQLFDALADDPFLISYQGHGGVDRLASEGLLTIGDVPTLGGSGKAIVAAVSCHIGLFGLPGFDALGEHLVLEPSGAVAVIAPVWLSHHGQARHLATQLFRALLPNPRESETAPATLGDAYLQAIQRFATARGVSPALLRTYNLLGDPALRLPSSQ
ncbi:MAG: C25 family cysteine peptidase [Acidobacteriota bacterium]